MLGGCGGIGTVATRTLVATDDVDEIVVADVRADAAAALADELGDPRLRGAGFDATDPASVAEVIDGADVVLSCVGPFYRFGEPLLAAAIDAGVAFVDVCDDLDATERQLALHDRAVAAGVTAVIGMGNSPGLANVLARYAADLLLDEVTSVDIMHIHGGEPDEGGAVIRHRIHAMTNDVPVFVDGEQRMVRMLEPSGAEFVVDTDFRDVGRYPVYPYPHPETITLPRHLPGLRRATNLGVVFPLPYFELTMDVVRTGICTTEPIEVDGTEVVPRDVAVAHILRERPRLLAEAGITGPAGCLKVVVGGTSGGEEHTWVFSLSSSGDGAGEGTGIPAGLGALMVLRGDVAGPGVLPPEAAVDPVAMLALAAEVLPRIGLSSAGGGGATVPLHLEHVLPDGSREEVALDL